MSDDVGICLFCGVGINLTEEKKLTVPNDEYSVFWLCVNCGNVNPDKEMSKISDINMKEKQEELNRWR